LRWEKKGLNLGQFEFLSRMKVRCQLSVATDHGQRTDPIPQSEIRNQMARHFSPRPANGPIVAIGGKNSTTIFGRGGFNAEVAESAEGRGGGGSGVSGQLSVVSCNGRRTTDNGQIQFRNPPSAFPSGSRLWTLGSRLSIRIPQSEIPDLQPLPTGSFTRRAYWA